MEKFIIYNVRPIAKLPTNKNCLKVEFLTFYAKNSRSLEVGLVFFSVTTPWSVVQNSKTRQWHPGLFFGPVSPVLALLYWPDLGGMTADSLDSDTFGKISPKKKALVASAFNTKMVL